MKFIAHIGIGYWGKNILRNLHELGVLYGAYDSDYNVMKNFHSKYPDAVFFVSLDELLSNDNIKAVTIATPASTHYNIVKKALLAGKDVFVEKPIALNVSEVEELIKIAEQNKRVLMVGHILRYHPAVRKLKELINEGKLGKIQYIYSNRLNIGKFRTEENILWSFAPHDISVILMLLDEEEPAKISAFGGSYLNKDIYDVTLTALEFKNDVRAHIFVSWLHPYKEQKLVVVGSECMAVFDDLTEEKLFLYPHKIEWKNGKIPFAHKAEYQVVPINMVEPLKLELLHFIDCVIKRGKPETDGYEGLRVVKIIEIAEELLNLKPK
jgi:UDP-2-acetamido-3-amino-2,3-dideoxy-glucuronate N-acetyltransferase